MRLSAKVSTRIRPDLRAALRRDPEIRAFVLDQASAGADHARGLVNDDSSEYGRETKAVPTPQGARIVAGADHSTYLEQGTRWMLGQRILLRTKGWLERGIDTTGQTTPSLTRGVPNGLTTVQARRLRRGIRRR